MNIFVIFLLLIIILSMLKIKISIYFKFDNFETYIRVKGRFINYERKGSLILRKKKYIIKKSWTKFIKDKSVNKEKLVSFLKHVEIDKLNISVFVDFILLMPTVFAVPLISTFLEYIKKVQFKKLKNYEYKVIPLYREEPKVFFELDSIVKIRIIDLFRLGINLLKNVGVAPLGDPQK